MQGAFGGPIVVGDSESRESADAAIASLLAGDEAAPKAPGLVPIRARAGELVYTGVLRTNLAAIASRVPVRGGWCPVSSEYFAITADAQAYHCWWELPEAWRAETFVAAAARSCAWS